MSRASTSANAVDPAAAFAALGDRTRLAIITQLRDGQPRSINWLATRLAADTDITRQAVTKHLRVLERAGLVRTRRVGRESQCSFQPEVVAGLRDYLDTVSRQWEDALTRLKSFVED